MSGAKYDVFVSYSKSDLPFARRLTDALQARGVRVWYDEGQLRIGDAVLRSIEQALERSRYFVLVISPEYVSNQWANFEMGVALSRDATSDTERIIPIYVRSVDRSALPPRIANIHAVDASGQSAEQIASDLASIVVGDKRKQKS